MHRSSEAPDTDCEALAPAPWQLEGSGYIVLMRLPSKHLQSRVSDADQVPGRLLTGISVLMLVDYRSSPVGPYREILFIPGRFRIGRQKFWSITDICVSTAESVTAGRENWGIPKELADFDVTREADNTEWIEVRQAGRRVAQLVFDRAGPGMPFAGNMIPRGLRTFFQELGGSSFRFTPDATGSLQYTRLRAIRTDHRRFPELRTSNVIVAVRVPNFSMTFPVAKIGAHSDR